MEKHGGDFMYGNNDIEIKFSTKHLPFEYKWLEFRLVVNKELYDDAVIDLKTFKEMEQSLLSRITKIRNEHANDLTIDSNGGNMHATK